MRVTVNGKTLEVRAGLTVTALLRELRLAPGPVAIEINRAIVVRAEHARHELQEGDEVEIVSFGRGG